MNTFFLNMNTMQIKFCSNLHSQTLRQSAKNNSSPLLILQHGCITIFIWLQLNHKALHNVSSNFFILILVGYKKSGWWDEAILRVYKCTLCSSMDWHLKFKNVAWKVEDISCWKRMTFLAFMDKKLTFMFYSIPHVIMYKFVKPYKNYIKLYKNLILLKYKTQF